MEPWLGICHLRKTDDTGENYTTMAAVLCRDHETYDHALKAILEPQGYQLVWSEEVHPAGHWIARHPVERSAVGLARAVHAGRTVEIGTLKATGAKGEDAPESQYLTITEHEIAPLPAQSSIPFWEQKWIAPELKDLLFSQPEDGAKLQTYFIVDAMLRKNITGVFDLDSAAIDVPIQCLFKGEAAGDFKEAAPYLIDMTLPDRAWEDRDYVPAFHKDFFKKHWGKNTGIFIRTTALMSEVRRHFRRFPRIQDSNGKWFYFRFWDSRSASYYFSGLRKNAEKISDWFQIGEAYSVQSIVMEEDEGEENLALVMKPSSELKYEKRKFTFTQEEWNIMSSFAEERFYKRMIKSLVRDFPKIDKSDVEGTVKENRKNVLNFGLSTERDIYALNRATLKWGQGFYMREPFEYDFTRTKDDQARLGKYMRLWAA